jgi:NADH-quinone oxidoreductase subunit J
VDLHGASAARARGRRRGPGGGRVVNDITAQEYAFIVTAVIGSISAVAVVTARNVVHAALYLVVTLASVGITFVLLGAEFLGWVQILIYVGAIVILFLFGLMLTKAPIGRDTLDNQQRWLGALVGIVVFAGLVFLIQDAFPIGDAVAQGGSQTSTEMIGQAIFSRYVLPFEAVSFLLLAALIGAIVLSRKDEGS